MPVPSLLPIPVPPPGRRVRAGGLHGAALALAAADTARSNPGLTVLVAGDAREADRLAPALRFFLGEDFPLQRFPDWETLPYDIFSPHQDIVSERLETLYRLPGMGRGLVLVTVATLLQRLPPADYVAGRSLLLGVGERLELDAMVGRLETAGYRRVAQVMEHGEFAIRGSLFDLFPMGSRHPYRIDLLDDEVDSIRRFDPETQRSDQTLDEIRVLPAREFPLDEAAVRAFRQRFRVRFEGDPQRSLVYREVSSGQIPGGIEYYLPLFFDGLAAFHEYLPPDALMLDCGDPEGYASRAWDEIRDRHAARRHDIERPLLDPEELWIEPAEMTHGLSVRPRISLGRFDPAEGDADVADVPTVAAPPGLRIDPKAEDPVHALRDFLAGFTEGGRVLFCAESAGRRETLMDFLQDAGIDAPQVRDWSGFLASDRATTVTVAPVDEGLSLPDAGIAVIAEPQLFGDRTHQRRRRRSVKDPEAIIRDLSSLEVGAPVVHEDHGVGRYQGLQTLNIGGSESEFLTLEYAGGDRLYVPVASLHLISRYTGATPEKAPLHRLGGDQWDKARRRAARRARDAAAELLDLYSRRAARSGHAFGIPETEYRAFAEDFPFELTADQEHAIESVLEDLSSSQPMDRLVCGDVGFGKTEVALRAAFIAAMCGKQVAVLVPTTLLAQQHLESFNDRLADWPVKVAALSRFRTRKQAGEILAALADGDLDIVIGTHRLLQDDVRFQRLGLVIIDEEHRFGVRHKERLKQLRAEVDVLTLTATPIPRTLNMAMGGLRDLSIIATPPAERLSVKTFVSTWDDALIREACLREIRRGGQIYFLHNTVQTIERTAEKLRELVPEADLRVAHGRMPESRLEQVMMDFYHRRFNMLVCSTIIESGIDIPTANTIIIDRADRFGVAQLHQLRGRVGRSHHRAYAYLLAPPLAALSADARKRLEAIEALEELGAGFTLATHDLEIRGAGELLGEEQSGQIHEVGFSLYAELLDRAVKALRRGEEPDPEGGLQHGPEVEMHVPALLPEDYIPDVHTRLVIYKRLNDAEDEEALRTLQVEMIDRFGLLPERAKTLIRIMELKLLARPIGVRKLDAGPQGARVIFEPQPRVDPATVIALVQSDPGRYRLDTESVLRLHADLEDVEQRFSVIRELLRRLAVRAAA